MRSILLIKQGKHSLSVQYSKTFWWSKFHDFSSLQMSIVPPIPFMMLFCIKDARTGSKGARVPTLLHKSEDLVHQSWSHKEEK